MPAVVIRQKSAHVVARQVHPAPQDYLFDQVPDPLVGAQLEGTTVIQYTPYLTWGRGAPARRGIAGSGCNRGGSEATPALQAMDQTAQAVATTMPDGASTIRDRYCPGVLECPAAAS